MCKTHSIYTIVGLTFQLDIQQDIYSTYYHNRAPVSLALPHNPTLNSTYLWGTFPWFHMEMPHDITYNLQYQHSINYSINTQVKYGSMYITESRKQDQELNLNYLLFRQSMALLFHLINFMTTNQWTCTQYGHSKYTNDSKFHITKISEH